MSLWFGVGAFVVVALVFLLVPLFRQKSALAGRQGDVRWPAVGVLGVLPALTVGLYIYLGAPDIIKEQALIRAQLNYDADGMVKALEDKLKAAPEDPEGWYALGRAYIAYKRYAEAEQVLDKARSQAPKDARILAQYAEAIALRQGNLDGRPIELIKEALEISHEEIKALELAGLEAFQKERWAESLHYWRRLLKLLPKDTEHHEVITQAVRRAEGELGRRLEGTGVPLPAAPTEPKKAPH
jgi:cytochrome c-type biogenesis protein CcmH